MMSIEFAIKAVVLLIDVFVLAYAVRRIKKADKEIDRLTHQLRIERWAADCSRRDIGFWSNLAELREKKIQQIVAMQIIAKERPADNG